MRFLLSLVLVALAIAAALGSGAGAMLSRNVLDTAGFTRAVVATVQSPAGVGLVRAAVANEVANRAAAQPDVIAGAAAGIAGNWAVRAVRSDAAAQILAPVAVGLQQGILTGDAPRVLRPGAITDAMLEEALQTPLSPQLDDAPRAPGTLAAHYAPRLPVVLIAAPGDVADPRSTTLIAPSGTVAPGFHAVVDAGATPAAYAERLYALLRASDMSGAARIAVLPPEQTGIGIAVLDRLRRAAASA